MTTAREIMTKEAEYLKDDQTVEAAARRLAEEDIGFVPVCNAEGRLQGVVTDRDIVVKVIAGGMDPHGTSLRELTDQEEVVTIGADDDLDEAVRTMKQHKVRRLPVIDGDRMVGMVSQGDLAGVLPPEQFADLVAAISA